MRQLARYGKHLGGAVKSTTHPLKHSLQEKRKNPEEFKHHQESRSTAQKHIAHSKGEEKYTSEEWFY